MWWPSLEKELGEIKEADPQPQPDQPEEVDTNRILEEILELSRINQKLLRDPDVSLREQIQEFQILTDRMMHERAKLSSDKYSRPSSTMNRSVLSDLSSFKENGSPVGRLVYLQMLFSVSRERFPWVYDSGMELIRTMKRRPKTPIDGIQEYQEFIDILSFTFRSGAFENRSMSKSDHMFFNEYVHRVRNELDELR